MAHGGCTEATPDPTASRGRCEGAGTTLQPLGVVRGLSASSHLLLRDATPKGLQRVPVPPFCPCHSPEVPSAGAGHPLCAHPWGSGPQEAAGAHWRPLGTRAPPNRGHHQQPRSPSSPAAPRGDAGRTALLAPFFSFLGFDFYFFLPFFPPPHRGQLRGGEGLRVSPPSQEAGKPRPCLSCPAPAPPGRGAPREPGGSPGGSRGARGEAPQPPPAHSPAPSVFSEPRLQVTCRVSSFTWKVFLSGRCDFLE